MVTEIVRQFRHIDTSDLPDFRNFTTYLNMGLWVLWATKEKLQTRKLTAEQIALFLRDVKEVSVRANSITQAFKRAGNKIHVHYENGEILFEIMMAGKQHLLSLTKEGTVEVFYFEPGKKYTPKRLGNYPLTSRNNCVIMVV